MSSTQEAVAAEERKEDTIDLWEHMICQILPMVGNRIILVRAKPARGDDQAKEFWSLPGSLFSKQLCHLHDEEPGEYARRIVADQTGMRVRSIKLAKLQTFRKKHPPKFIYTARVSGNPFPGTAIKEVGIFELSELPQDLGPHKEALQLLLYKLAPSG